MKKRCNERCIPYERIPTNCLRPAFDAQQNEKEARKMMNGGEDEVVDKFREYSDEISKKMTSKSVLSEIFTFDLIKLLITW